MAECGSDLYEQQLFAVFESCLTKGENELDESNLLSICSKLHLDELIDELKLCICKHRPNKQTISFQEFRDGLLLLLRKSQGLITDKQHVQPYHNVNICQLDIDKDQVSSLITEASRACLRNMKSNAIDENGMIHLWEKVKVYLQRDTDPSTIRFISSCLEIPELPKQITESLFESLDRNCDGLISFDEFVIVFHKKRDRKVLRGDIVPPCSSIVNYDVNMLDCNTHTCLTYDGINPNKKTNDSDELEKETVTHVSNTKELSSIVDLDALDASLEQIANIICDELKNLDESLNNTTIQTHIRLLQEMLTVHQDEQRNLTAMIDSMKMEREKMRLDMLEANERANLLTQEIDECHVQLEKTRKDLQRQSEQRYAEIAKELSDQLNLEREMDAAALKSKDDQLEALQKENHDMKNKIVDTFQETQMLEAENKTLLNQIEKLRQSNNDLLMQIKMLNAEHDEIQSLETKQQEQVDFFVDRIKQLQSEVTLLRDQNDELGAELENLKCYSKDMRYEDNASSLAYDLHELSENRNENSCHLGQEFRVSNRLSGEGTSFSFSSISTNGDGQTDAIKYTLFADMIVRDLENILSTNVKCQVDKCALRDGISKLISGLRSKQNTYELELHSARDFGKSIASELEMECEVRVNESLRDLVVSKTPKPAKRTAMSNTTVDLDNFPAQDVKSSMQSKATTLRDYPPRKEEHILDQCKVNKEKINLSNVTQVESVPKSAITNVELLEIEKKQLLERCQELERSLELLKVEYEECEDYWAAKLEEERQLFEQEQKLSDDKLAELINKITEYEELISPSDKSKSNGRLSPIEEKFNLEQQYIELEEEFEKWKVKMENDISQKNLEIEHLYEKLRLTQQPATNDSCIQVPEENSLAIVSNSGTSGIPSTNEIFINMDLYGTNEMCRATVTECPLSNNVNKLMKQNDHVDDNNLYNIGCNESAIKLIKSAHQEQKVYYNNPPAATKTMFTMNENGKENEIEFKLMHDVITETGCGCTQNNDQQQVGCVDVNIFQNLKLKLYAQERKKRHLQRCIKQQRRYIEKLLQRIMVQHHTEVCELQCLLRDTQERLHIQVQTTVDQADKLANADILVKDLYIENAYLTSYAKRLQEQYLIFRSLDAGSTSM